MYLPVLCPVCGSRLPSSARQPLEPCICQCCVRCVGADCQAQQDTVLCPVCGSRLPSSSRQCCVRCVGADCQAQQDSVVSGVWEQIAKVSKTVLCPVCGSRLPSSARQCCVRCVRADCQAQQDSHIEIHKLYPNNPQIAVIYKIHQKTAKSFRAPKINFTDILLLKNSIKLISS